MIYVALLLIFLITLSEAIAQYCIRCARNHTCTKTRCITLIGIGMLCYCIVGFLLYKVYSFEELGVTNLIWSCMSIIIAFIVGKMFFSERIKIHDIIAITLAIIAIIFASMK